MFEKEAEEIAKDIYIHHFDDDINYPDVLKAITVGVQKGTEHGYNKGKKELAQENAELKEQVKEWKALQELYDGKAFKWQGKYGDVNKQLTKAKEIIRALLEHTYGQNLNTQNDFDLYLGRIKEAEQFLKEVVK